MFNRSKFKQTGRQVRQQAVKRNYKVYRSKYNPDTSLINSSPKSKILLKLGGFFKTVKFTFKSLRRRVISIKQRITRTFFWGRSKFSRYIVHAFLILLIGLLVGTSITNKPIVPTVNPSAVNVGLGSQTLASSDDFTIVTQAGETKIPTNRKVSTIVNYIVQNGDSVSSIADRFGITADTLKIANNIQDDSIKVGQSLKVLPISGLLHKVEAGDTLESLTGKYKLADSGFSSQIIADWNNFDDFNLQIGAEIIIPGGRLTPKQEVVTVASNFPQVIQSGPIVDDGLWTKPTSGGGYILTQCYKGSAHDGLDMAKLWSGATPNIVAARSGTVILSGWEGGWTVRIAHSDGFETVYYHMAYPSPLKVGAKVNGGQFLGVMGSTGWSTGTHLHFIIKRNRVTVNPLNYINLRTGGDVVRC